jgi:hypothetical protein
MQSLEISDAVRPLKWPLGVKWLISALDVVGRQRHAAAALPRKRSGTHCIGG